MRGSRTKEGMKEDWTDRMDWIEIGSDRKGSGRGRKNSLESA